MRPFAFYEPDKKTKESKVKTKRKRVIWLDIAKGIAILSVVLYHTGFLPLQKQLLPIITSYMLPIFCVIGGYTYTQQNNHIIFFKKKVKSLIIPYFVVGILSYLIWFVLISISNYQIIKLNLQDQFIQFLLGKNLIFNGPLWFLATFFWQLFFLILSFFLLKIDLFFSKSDYHFFYLLHLISSI